MYFSLTVCGKRGNSSYISGVLPYFEGDHTYWNVSFIPIRVGEFSIVVTEDNSGITDSTLHFIVTPGMTLTFSSLFLSYIHKDSHIM